MRFREWEHDDRQAAEGAGDGGSTSGDLDEVRRRGEDLLRTGREAIQRTLSGDSEGYLRMVRQRGGQ
jgi:hypothetical protein